MSVAPTAPKLGLTDVTDGTTVNTFPGLTVVIDTPAENTRTTPVTAVTGTTTVNDEPSAATDTGTTADVNPPPTAENRTVASAVNPEPTTVTTAPTGAGAGNTPTVGVGNTTKSVALDTVTPPPVTVTRPDTAPTGTTTVICDAEIIGDPATTPPKLTELPATKFDPDTTTDAPTAAEPGVTPATVGVGNTVKFPALTATPSGVDTRTTPVTAPSGTTTVIDVSDTTTGLTAATPPNVTDVAPVKLLPVTVTVAPTTADPTLNPVIRGNTVKLTALVAVPPAVTTVTTPDVAPTGTDVVIDVDDTTVNVDCNTPLNRTAVAPVKPEPVIVTAPATAAPPTGVTALIVGITAKSAALVAVPPGATTVIRPVTAPAGTVTVIDVSDTTGLTATTPPNRTAVAPANDVPEIVTSDPTTPEPTDTAVILGTTVNAELVAVPDAVTTLTTPDATPNNDGTTNVTVWSFTTLNDDTATDPTDTAVAPVNESPTTVTVSPTDADDTDKEPNRGATVNAVAVATTRPPANSSTGADDAPAGTFTRKLVPPPPDVANAAPETDTAPNRTDRTFAKFVPDTVT